MGKFKKISVEKIISECDQSLKLRRDESYLCRKDIALKEYLEELLFLRTDYDRLNDFEHSQCAKLLEEIGRLRAELEQVKAERWVPVSEEMPVAKQAVLICYCGNVIPAVRDMSILHRGWWSTVDLICYPENKVTHWMPLPEPPKEAT